MPVILLMNHLRKIYSACSPRFFRNFLSQAYHCEEQWNERLSSALLSQVNFDELNNELLKAFSASAKVTPVDFDIYVNKMTDENHLIDFEEIINRFRRSPSTAFVLPSSQHAVIRALVKLNKSDLLMKMLNDRLNYGIFLDSYTSCLLMDMFLKGNNYQDAAKCAIQLMLQEDFGSDLSKSLAMYSCFLYLFNPSTEPWNPFPKPVIEEPEEEVKVRVDYIREPYFDDHFDLENPQHLIGKTFAYANLDGSGSYELSLQLLGWTLYEKFNNLKEVLKVILDTKTPIYDEIFEKVFEMVSSSNSENKDNILDCLSKVKHSGKLLENSIEQKMKEDIENAVKNFEKKYIDTQTKLYKEWQSERETLVKEQVKSLEKLKKLKEIEEKKKQLQEKENHLFFFEKEEKWLLQAEKNEQLLKELMDKIPKYEKKQMEKKDDSYLPPEMPTNR
ncbi:small ribosomal subunit protein mS27-like [Artemia franciscana]|uniref:Mitochondrial 28S ribosomal protein S27 n=1 Tax=Artemia franciscana TaxID=6661 RepID=A0AA88KY72_ARTSF|nr:hypothetical protein QYM36_012879 [Artemia franciscana]